jgi:hypothetical protein
MPIYTFRCTAGHTFDRQLTKDQFVAGGHRCEVGTCRKSAKRDFIPVPGGVAKVARNLSYPYYSWQLPLQPDPVTGKRTKPVIVESAKHEADIVAGKLGDEYRMNQI